MSSAVDMVVVIRRGRKGGSCWRDKSCCFSIHPFSQTALVELESLVTDSPSRSRSGRCHSSPRRLRQASMALPWFSSQYPSPTLSPSWLTSCLAALTDIDPTLSNPALIKQANAQFLLSDLKDSTVRGSGLPAGVEEMETGVLWEGGVGGRGKGGVLQVVGIMDVSIAFSSSSKLIDVHVCAYLSHCTQRHLLTPLAVIFRSQHQPLP